MKKILIVIPYFIPAYSYGGPVKVAYDHAIGLIKKGYEVTVVTTDALDAKNRNKIKDETIDGIHIVRFRNMSNYLAKFYNIYLPIWMKKWFQTNISDYDVVHIHDFFTMPTIWAAKYARKNNIKYFVQPHGSANFNPKRGKSFVKKSFFSLFWNTILSCSDKIIAVSKSEKDEIYFEGDKNKIKILYNGISYKDIEDEINKITEDDVYNFRKKYGLIWKKIILSVWRLQKVKRFDKLIDYSKELLKNNSEWKVLIVWPDEWEKENLLSQIEKEKLQGKVILTGWLYWKEKYISYNITNIYSLCSDSEGLSMTILDAIYYDLPLLISKECNFDFPYENIVVFSDLQEFKTWMEKLSKNFRNKYPKEFKEKFDIDTCIYNLIDIYLGK